MKLCALLLLAASAVLTCPLTAQDSPEEPSRGPDAGTRTHVHGIQVFPAAGRPFSAKDNIKWTHNLQDGSTVTTYLFASVARDSQGRIYREHRHLVPGNTYQQFVQEYFVLLDPVAHTRTACTMKTRRCVISVYRASTKFVRLPDRPHDEGTGYLSRESLGTGVVDNLNVVGTRETLSIGPGTVGNAQSLVATGEFWYSPDLQVNLSVTRKDPRIGTQLLQLVDLARAEPDPAIFQVPDGFVVQDLRVSARAEKAALGH